ncbi:rve domain-containing protein [Tanacetum coccineum]
MIVVVYYFTKWVKAKLLASITSHNVLTFIYDQIITEFGMPQTIIIVNGTQFIGEPFKSWYKAHGIHWATTSSYHSQANGQAEVFNKEIIKGIEKRMEEYKTCEGIKICVPLLVAQRAIQIMVQSIRIHWATTSPYHSKANGQAEVANKEIVKDIKKRMKEYKTCWVDKLLSVL